MNEYSRIRCAFEVNTIYDIEFRKNGLEGIFLNELKPENPYVKNYDLYENPEDWIKKFEMSRWGIFISKFENVKDAGGVIVACKTKDIILPENRDDAAVIWDIRINPEFRRKGVGKMLFNKAVEFAKEMNCSLIKIETQNTNVPACKFYAEMGCYLGGIRKNMYNEFPEEYQLLWYYDL